MGEIAKPNISSSDSDALRVDFISVTPKADEGAAHMVSPGRGFLAEEFDRFYPTVMTIEDGRVVLAGDVRMSRTLRPTSPVKMMLARRALEQLG